MSSVSEIYEFVLDLTVQMGVLMKEGFNSKLHIETKEATYDVVTEYDRRIENFFMENISKKYPSHKFIAEEQSSTRNTAEVLTDDPTWIIDPIDGTANYIRRNPITCISVGFLVKKEMTIGIVYNPIQNELFTACKGQGAFLNGTRIFASKRTDIDLAVVGLEVTLARREQWYEKNIQRLQAVVKKAQGIRSYGCAAMSLCYVANGTIDAYNVDNLYPWDVAAAGLIIREAGGCVLNTRGGEFDVMKPNILCAGTEELCRELVAIFKEVNLY